MDFILKINDILWIIYYKILDVVNFFRFKPYFSFFIVQSII